MISAGSTRWWTEPTTCNIPSCSGCMFFTGMRVSELCRIEVADVDLENCKIFVSQGKGSKDRYVLFGKTFATALRTHIAAHPSNRWLFQTRRNSEVFHAASRADRQKYAEQAGVKATPQLSDTRRSPG